MLLEIQKTFDFFKVTAESEHIDRIVVSGGASRVDRFKAMLGQRFGVPSRSSTVPDRGLRHVRSRAQAEDLAAVPPWR